MTTPTTPISLAHPIQYAPGVGPRRAQLMNRLGINTVADLIKHLPVRYEFQAGQQRILDLPLNAVATARGTVVNCRWISGGGSPIGRGRSGGKGRFTATINDESGFLDLTLFNARYLKDKVHPGHQLIVTGKVTVYNDQRQMVNPNVQILDEKISPPSSASSASPNSTERYRPVYAATDALTSPQIDRVLQDILPHTLDQIDDHFTDDFRESRSLPTLANAYKTLHNPADADDVAHARRRLAYDELLLLQLGFALKRKHTTTQLTAPALKHSPAIDKEIRKHFPFDLTDAQNAVVNDIVSDLKTATPMNRLLQGDVGSGKTAVALYALLMAVAANKQGAIMAPTELLAEQHQLSIAAMLRDSNVSIALLTGSLTKAERQAMLYRIAKGKVDIVIGTHAILSKDVSFQDLAVVVVDEQHRFGVEQRAIIREKSADDTTPHTLVMTATPIPRTLSMTVFGDLDVSTIDALPPGRQPIKTITVPEQDSDSVYQTMADRLNQGEQAYVVLPAIDEADSGLKAVTTHVEHLSQTHLAAYNVAAIHGQLKRDQRELIMRKFRDHKIDVLIATTVIEVGVDVPNATMMVVEHAERFGLAQLHQLRGRVGRGSKASLCAFIADPTTEQGQQRIEAITSTIDGFKIAEADLLIRGIGEFFGPKQSGLPPFRVADLTKHIDLLKMARRDAKTLVDDDPRLTSPQNDLLKKRLFKQYGLALNLADVA